MTQEQIQQFIDLCERFMPKQVAADSPQQMAMYELYHRLKQAKDAAPAVQAEGEWKRKAGDAANRLFKQHNKPYEYHYQNIAIKPIRVESFVCGAEWMHTTYVLPLQAEINQLKQKEANND